MDANNKQTYLRFFHGFPSNVAVDLYLGDRKIASGLTFGGFTPYTAVDPGRYMLVVYPAGERNAPLIKNDVVVPSGEIYTVIIGDRQGLPALAPVEDPRFHLPEDRVALRLGNMAPGMEPVNALLRLGEGEFEDLFPDVEYGQVTEYAIIEPGRYTMDVQLTNGEKRVLWVPNINLRQGRYYSIYMIGQGKEGETEFPLIAVIPLDGNSYL